MLLKRKNLRNAKWQIIVLCTLTDRFYGLHLFHFWPAVWQYKALTVAMRPRISVNRFFFRILQEVFEKQYRPSGAHGHKYLVKCVLPNFTIRLWISSFFEVFPSGNSTDALQNFKIMLYTEAITQLSILKQRKVRCQ